jgi:hypothetical protein
MLPANLVASGYLPQSAIDEIGFPGLIQQGVTGSAAKRVQEWLSLNGHGVDIDADFGPATAHAVAAFQTAAGLTVSGTVDNQTWDALVTPMVAALQPIQPGTGGLAPLIAAYAAQHVAQHPLEVGGDNRGPWVRLYLGWDGEAAKWCAGFACFSLAQAAFTLGQAQPIQSSAACTTLAERAQSANLLKSAPAGGPPAGLAPGDFFLVRKVPGVWEHVGVVKAVGQTQFDTLEGNTDTNGSSNGYEAVARTRAYPGKDFICW